MKSFALIPLALFLVLSPPAANSLEIVPFSAQALQEAKRSNGPFALHFHSAWCATCKQQAKVFERLRGDPALDMKLLVVDYDEDRAAVRAFRVPVSGVVIVMRGESERARLINVVDEADLRAGLRKAF